MESSSGSAPVSTPNPSMMVFIDYENLSLSARAINSCFDVAALVSDLRLRGRIAAITAYGDFTGPWYELHRRALLEVGAQQVQLGRSSVKSQKNRADIRLAIDGTRTLLTRPDIGTFVIGTGDSDLSELVLTLREYGRRVICAAYRHATSDILLHICDEFIDLTPPSTEAAAFACDPASLLEHALQIARDGGRAEIAAATLKPLIKELDGSFDEKALGYENFRAFLQAHPAVAALTERSTPTGPPQLYVGSAVGKVPTAEAIPAPGNRSVVEVAA